MGSLTCQAKPSSISNDDRCVVYSIQLNHIVPKKQMGAFKILPALRRNKCNMHPIENEFIETGVYIIFARVANLKDGYYNLG